LESILDGLQGAYLEKREGWLAKWHSTDESYQCQCAVVCCVSITWLLSSKLARGACYIVVHGLHAFIVVVPSIAL